MPSISTKVDVNPSPLKLTFEVPWVEPWVNESELFSEPELTERFAVISAIVVAPKASIVSLEIISTGEAPSVALPLMKEPVTTTSSTASSCAKTKLTKKTEARSFNFMNFIFLPFINKIYIPFISKKWIYTKKS